MAHLASTCRLVHCGGVPFFSRSDRYTCMDCGHKWRVPKRVRRRKQNWRQGGYGTANAHSAGVNVMSNAYQSYLSSMKDQRNSVRDQNLEVASAFGTCPNCGSIRHTIT